MFKKKRKNIHLDYASTTPVDSLVFKKMKRFFSNDFYNPSSIYLKGKKVKEKIDDYRAKISKKLQIKPTEIIFTNGGTESVNMAILGIAKSGGHIISSKIEHPAVLDSLEEAKRLGCEVTLLPVNKDGLVSVLDLKKELKSNTKLVTISYATNEIGTIQPIRKIAVEIQKYKKELNRSENDFPYFHTDASQAGLTLDLNIDKLKVDLMTLDGSKIYGPKAAGVLIKKRYVELLPILFGGGQEQALRPGTENVSGIVGFSEAFILAESKKTETVRGFKKLQNYMLKKIEKEIPEAKLNGSLKNRLSNNVNICIPKINSEFAVIAMDELGVNCSAMTACKSLRGDSQSYAIEALDKKDCSGSSIRFSFGRETTKKDIDKVIKVLKQVIDFQLTNNN